VAERIREADAMAHLVAINLEDELKLRATVEGLAWAEADLAAAGEAGSVAAVAAAEVVEEAVADAAAVAADAAVADAAADDASWRFGPLPRILRNRNVLKEPRTNRD